MNLKLQPQLPPKEKKALCLYNVASNELDVISWLIDPFELVMDNPIAE